LHLPGERVKRLPPEIVSRIASGQIAVSPSSVLKELVENSIDAGAQEIRVTIEDQFNFRVFDNGTGMKLSELPLSVERFTTTKVKEIPDLENIVTYGFRGEALNAVSAVSFLTIKSRHFSEEVGGKLKVEGGKIRSCQPIPFRGGTSVRVQNLFFNVPVRRRSFSGRETKRMVSTVLSYAVSNPNISFAVNDIVLPPSTVEERIAAIYGGEGLRRIEGKHFRAFIGFRNEVSGSKVRKIFVNRRPVIYEKLEKFLLSLGLESFIFLIELSPSAVDVNISPLKDRVLIRDESLLFREVESLLKRDEFYVFKPSKTLLLREKEGGKLKVIGSNETLIVAEDENYFYFFDIHLLHERVNYEAVLRSLKEGRIRSVRLLEPIVVEGNVRNLSRFGIKFSKTERGIEVREIPEILTAEDVRRIASGKEVESVATAACRRAVKSGSILERKDIEELMELYLDCEERRFCPHGRPIYYRIEKRKIYRGLGRRI